MMSALTLGRLIQFSSLLLLVSFISCQEGSKEKHSSPNEPFPFVLPKEKPDRPLSAALERNYTYPAARPEDNELYSQFKYTELKGFDYHDFDGTISRRDPSKVIFANGKYYVWYTYRNTPTPPQGADNSNDTIPSRDWD